MYRVQVFCVGCIMCEVSLYTHLLPFFFLNGTPTALNRFEKSKYVCTCAQNSKRFQKSCFLSLCNILIHTLMCVTNWGTSWQHCSRASNLFRMSVHITIIISSAVWKELIYLHPQFSAVLGLICLKCTATPTFEVIGITMLPKKSVKMSEKKIECFQVGCFVVPL